MSPLPKRTKYQTGIRESVRQYTSVLRDKQWQQLLNLIPKPKGAGRPLELDLRQIINGIFYILVTGCQWRNLPNDYPNPNSVYSRYNKWSKDGTWRKINQRLLSLERLSIGRIARPSAGIIDSQSVKVSDQGGLSAYDGNKKIKGLKRHMLVDTLGNLLEVVVTAANFDDRKGARLLLSKVERQIALRLLKIWADKGYQGDLQDWFMQEWQISLEIVSAQAGQKGFAVQPCRWVVERSFAWLGKYRRLSKDYERDTLSSEAFIYLASISTLLKRIKD